MTKIELEARTKRFALAVIDCVSTIQRSLVADVLSRQLLRSATSIGANYREANRAESRADFIHKLGIVEKEAAESHYWIELLKGAGLGGRERLDALLKESEELVKIFSRARATTRSRPVKRIGVVS